MITAKHQASLVDQIKSMTELELQSFLEEVRDHVNKQNMMPMVESVFNFEDQSEDVDRLKSELDDMEDERDAAIRDLDDLKENVKEAITLLT